MNVFPLFYIFSIIIIIIISIFLVLENCKKQTQKIGESFRNKIEKLTSELDKNINNQNKFKSKYADYLEKKREYGNTATLMDEINIYKRQQLASIEQNALNGVTDWAKHLESR